MKCDLCGNVKPIIDDRLYIFPKGKPQIEHSEKCPNCMALLFGTVGPANTKEITKK